ncbi:MAG: J domain-containing protein [Wenzhouxiangellaceae bacterium]|nr:MAG: J domain-containing protein [Wenzhouxiangellaceae bacterium]
MEFKDYYKILGVKPEADQDEIKRAYRKLARKYHPDVSKEADAETRFKEVGEAYEALKDPNKRKAYDQVRSGGWRPGEEFRPPPNWGQGFDPGAFEGGEDFSGFSDFFSSLFGSRGPRRRGPMRSAGRDQHARIEVDLETAFAGGTRQISVARTVVGPDGVPRRQPDSIKVRLPAGLTDGRQLRLRGKGEPGLNGGPPGDLFLEIAVQPHPLFELHGRDLHLSLPIAPWEAALGAKVSVPTLAGKVEMNIPPGVSSGKRLRLKGRGLPGQTPGDQYVILKVLVPAAVSERQRELYQELAKEQAFDPRADMEVRS